MTDDTDTTDDNPLPPADTKVGQMLAQLGADEDSLVELTDKQRQVFKLKLRGFTQKAIGEVMGISQPAVAKHWKKIQERFAEVGASIDQERVVGESVSLYQEIEERAWELFYLAKSATNKDGKLQPKLGDANRALGTVMAAREKSLNLLMDLGLLKRAAIEHDHVLHESPLMEAWKKGDAQKRLRLTSRVIETQLEELDDPLPPEDITDAEYIELDELDEPTPDLD